MTGPVMKPTVSPGLTPRVRRGTRRAATLAAATTALLLGTALLAGPASAEVPIGWAEQEPVDKVFVLGALVGVPVLLFLVITALVYLPGLARGEKVGPGASGPQDQWLGGRRSTGEIPAGSGTTSETEPADGGASARW